MSSSFNESKDEETFTCLCLKNYIKVYYRYSIKMQCWNKLWICRVNTVFWHIESSTQEHFRNMSKTCSKLNMFLLSIWHRMKIWIDENTFGCGDPWREQLGSQEEELAVHNTERCKAISTPLNFTSQGFSWQSKNKHESTKIKFSVQECN